MSQITSEICSKTSYLNWKWRKSSKKDMPLNEKKRICNKNSSNSNKKILLYLGILLQIPFTLTKNAFTIQDFGIKKVSWYLTTYFLLNSRSSLWVSKKSCNEVWTRNF